MGKNDWMWLLGAVVVGYVFFNFTEPGRNLSNQFLQKTGVSLGSGTAGKPGGHVGLF